MTGIYRITHVDSGRTYVGQAQNLARRERRHFKALRDGRHKNPPLQAAWNKYGEAAFIFVVLEECATEVLTEREQCWLDHFRESGEVYNVGPCANPPWLGAKLSPEHRAKLSVAAKGRKASPETLIKMSAASTGRRPSPETRAKLSAWQIGRVLTPEHRAKISATLMGHSESAETRAKKSASHLGKKMPPRNIARMTSQYEARS